MSDGTGSAGREKAVALRYNDQETLPRVVASGVGEVARKIIEIAEANDIPLHDDPQLAELLAQLKPGSTIQPESFKLVAEVIAFLFHTDREWAKTHGFIEAVGGVKSHVEE